MSSIIENLTQEELIAKCVNQRIEINNLLASADRGHKYGVDRELEIRIAVMYLKHDKPKCALVTLNGYQRKWDGRTILRELAS